MAVIVTDDAGIASANRAVFGRAGPTDVITVRYRPEPGAAGSAEVLVNAERARAAGSRSGGAARELALYLAHGCDHLAGASDRTPAGRARMRRRERAWLAEARRLGYLDIVRPAKGAVRP